MKNNHKRTNVFLLNIIQNGSPHSNAQRIPAEICTSRDYNRCLPSVDVEGGKEVQEEGRAGVGVERGDAKGNSSWY